MTGPLEGRSALVTGGGSGIGLATASRLLRDGAKVTLCGRNGERLARAAATLGSDSVTTTPADVTSESDVEHAVSVAAEHGGGRLDIVVAAAGTGSAGPVTAMSLDAWRGVMAVNLDGAFLTIKHGATAIAAAGGGSIVAVSSIAAPLTHRLMSAYCVSKAALEALVRNAADELGAQGIRVNAVRPGLVPTDISMGLTASEAIVEDYLDQMPIRRLGTVDDVAEGIRYLAGPESGWVTGQCLAIDGGHTLRRGPDLSVAFRPR